MNNPSFIITTFFHTLNTDMHQSPYFLLKYGPPCLIVSALFLLHILNKDQTGSCDHEKSEKSH